MKYAIITCINGNFAVKAEYDSLDKAKVGYHQQCAVLWNASDVVDAEISVLNETLTTVVTEHIQHVVESDNSDEPNV
jgi:hypothetical protein